MTLLAPAWLWAALVVPLIWWLHRGGEPRASRLVASLAPFRGAASAETARQPAARTDPAWIRRALIAALLVAALAAPALTVPPDAVTVWLDGAASLDTREADGRRLERALAELDAALARRGAANVELRSLAAPGFRAPWSRPGDARALADTLPRGSALPPAVELLAADREQWLLTDGAGAAVVEFAAQAPLARVIQVGAATENVGLVTLAARPQPADPATTAVAVTLANAGRAGTERTVTLTREAAALATARVRLGPGETRTLSFVVPSAPGRLGAALDAGDGLAADDRLALASTRALTAPVAVDPDCARGIAAVARAVAGAALADAARAALLIDCTGRYDGLSSLRLRLRRGAQPRLLADLHFGAGEAGAPPLPARVWGEAAPRASVADGPVVLEARSGIVAALGSGPARVLDVYADLEDPRVVADEAFPMLLARLMERALGAELVAPVTRGDRPPGDLNIAPRARLVARGAGTPRDAQRRDLAPLLLCLAAALLGLDRLQALRVWRTAPGGP